MTEKKKIERKYRLPNVASRIAEYAGQHIGEEIKQRVLDLYEYQGQRANELLGELRPIVKERLDAFKVSALAWLERIVKEGKAGVIASKRISGKQNAEMFLRKPDLFDHTGQAFGGACSIAECKAWLEKVKLDPARATLMDLYFGTYRNVARIKSYSEAINKYKQLLEEIKILFSED